MASAEEGPIVATRTLSPESARPSANGSPVTSRLGMSDPSASRILVADASASLLAMSDPPTRIVSDQTVSRVAPDPTAMRIVVPDPSTNRGGVSESQARVSPKPSAHRSMPSESSLPVLKSSGSAAGTGNGNGATTPVNCSVGPAGGSTIKGVGSGESLAALRVLVVDDDCES